MKNIHRIWHKDGSRFSETWYGCDCGEPLRHVGVTDYDYRYGDSTSLYQCPKCKDVHMGLTRREEDFLGRGWVLEKINSN